MSKRYVCLHGHFYQPPRENPWLEAIEVQDSAAPFHDWNARVTAECYAPNARARILGDGGRIADLVNNYASMSFNFGPTLLSWLEVHAERCYRDILAADARGTLRFDGHGPAMAQCYNHLIMPLANDRDRQTQVRWGIRDFEHRFGRRPEGMWLPECAANTASLEALAAEGIAFTVLAPRQAARVRPLDACGNPADDWQNVHEGNVDPRRAYRCDLPSGRSIALFFYDGPIAQAVAFDQLLVRGETFAGRLPAHFDPGRDDDQLVHIATDGETYGHHHRKGEMALAYAIRTLEAMPDIELTCYGAFLAHHPPTWQAEIVEDSSWSCAHGVERWRHDCGCATRADWHQQWRAPLRDALDHLRDEVEPLYQDRAARLLKDPWAARDAYIDVLLDRSPARVDAFFAEHARRPLDAAETVEALELLELQRHAMLMYTSCGWFFDELSGLETVQVIQYAGRVVQIASRYTEDPIEEAFTDRLSQAPSNLPDLGDGRAIYHRWVVPALLDLRRVAAHHALADVFRPQHDPHPIYCYEIDGNEISRHKLGETRLVIGEATVQSRITRETASYTYAVLYTGGFDFTAGVVPVGLIDPATLKAALATPFGCGEISTAIRTLDQLFGSDVFTLRALFRDEQRFVIDHILESRVRETEATLSQLHARTGPMMRFLTALGTPSPAIFRHAAEGMITGRLRRLFTQRPLDIRAIDALLDEAQTTGVPLDEATLGYALSNALCCHADALTHNPRDLDTLRAMYAMSHLADRLPFETNRWCAQRAVFDLHVTVHPEMRRTDTDEARQWVETFRALGENLRLLIDLPPDIAPPAEPLPAEPLPAEPLPADLPPVTPRLPIGLLPVDPPLSADAPVETAR